jgi:hypothetical protein
MSIAKALLLGVWLSSFGTLAYLYRVIYRKLPSSTTSVGSDVFTAYTTHNIAWWFGIAACFVIAFMILKAWPGKPALWIALAVTELFPVGLVVMFMMLAARNREVIERMAGK